jgi:RNA polymerase sigma-70 factor, ECF subfamily
MDDRADRGSDADAAAREDLELARAAAAGDAGALDRLLARHHDRIHLICRKILRDPQDAADARQEAMILITRHIGSFEGRNDFGAWVYRIATNASIDLHRRAYRREEAADHLSQIVSPSSGTSTIIRTRLDVDRALEQLPVEYREAVVMRAIGDLEYSDIAEILDVPIGTVRSRIARGREMLVQLLT